MSVGSTWIGCDLGHRTGSEDVDNVQGDAVGNSVGGMANAVEGFSVRFTEDGQADGTATVADGSVVGAADDEGDEEGDNAAVGSIQGLAVGTIDDGIAGAVAPLAIRGARQIEGDTDVDGRKVEEFSKVGTFEGFIEGDAVLALMTLEVALTRAATSAVERFGAPSAVVEPLERSFSLDPTATVGTAETRVSFTRTASFDNNGFSNVGVANGTSAVGAVVVGCPVGICPSVRFSPMVLFDSTEIAVSFKISVVFARVTRSEGVFTSPRELKDGGYDDDVGRTVGTASVTAASNDDGQVVGRAKAMRSQKTRSRYRHS